MAKRRTRHRIQKRVRRGTMKGGMDVLNPILHNDEDSHNLDMGNDNSFQSQGSLHLSHLNTSENSGNTTEQSIVPGDFGDLDSIPPDESNIIDMDQSLHLADLDTTETDNSGYTRGVDELFGGKKRRRSTKKRYGKKGRKTRKNRRHKQRGGICYGNGVGANSYDPNYSIYNTNMLKLFPYKA